MKDTIRNSQLALPMVVLFELYMIITWFIHFDDKMSVGSLGYIICYVSLIVATLLAYGYIYYYKKDIVSNYRKLDILQHCYALTFLLWALAFTYIGSEFRDRFDCLIYVTIVTIIPLFTFLRPYIWLIMQVASAAFMLYLGSHHEHFYAFATNFSIFSIISCAAGWSIYRIRLSGYTRQAEFEQERKRVHDLAYTDQLTNLPNRHSFNETIERLQKQKIPEDLIVLVLDVNGLKGTNDTYGHDVGDVLIDGAASCMHQAFASLGTVYRVGGDEFYGLMRCSEEKLANLLQRFELLTSLWSRQKGVSLSVSVGYASVKANPNDRLSALITKADNAMYENKQQHYAQQRQMQK